MGSLAFLAASLLPGMLPALAAYQGAARVADNAVRPPWPNSNYVKSRHLGFNDNDEHGWRFQKEIDKNALLRL